MRERVYRKPLHLQGKLAFFELNGAKLYASVSFPQRGHDPYNSSAGCDSRIDMNVDSFTGNTEKFWYRQLAMSWLSRRCQRRRTSCLVDLRVSAATQ